MARPKGSKDLKKRFSRSCRVTSKMIGQKFNRLFVEKIVTKGKIVKIQVLCDCGTRKVVLAYNVRAGDIKSCGCYHREEMIKRQTKPNCESAKKSVFMNYKCNAELRSYSFELTFEQTMNLIFQNCYYCDQPPSREVKKVGGSIIVNGIDRVDNSIGYTIENTVPCCETCNKKKHFVSRQIIERAYEFFKKL